MKKWILQAILSTPRLTNAGSQFSNRNGLKGSLIVLVQSDLGKKIGKSSSLPCPFNFQKIFYLSSLLYAPKDNLRKTIIHLTGTNRLFERRGNCDQKQRIFGDQQ